MAIIVEKGTRIPMNASGLPNPDFITVEPASKDLTYFTTHDGVAVGWPRLEFFYIRPGMRIPAWTQVCIKKGGEKTCHFLSESDELLEKAVNGIKPDYISAVFTTSAEMSAWKLHDYWGEVADCHIVKVAGKYQMMSDKELLDHARKVKVPA